MNKTYNTAYGNVFFDLSADAIAVKMSGGYDSSVMLYALAHAINDTQQYHINIRPVSVKKIGPKNDMKDMTKADPTPIVQRVIDFTRKSFPKVNIDNSRVYELANWWDDNLYKLAQTSALELLDTDISMVYNGITKNPTVQLNGAWNEPDAMRDADATCTPAIENTVSVYEGSHAEPFRNADKRIVFALADQLEIVEDMMSMTWSCEGFGHMTDNFKKPCDTCWWCLEREWAYNTYNA